MQVSNIEEYTRIEPLDDPAEIELIHRQFPHGVVVECDFPEWAVAERWCWRMFGPRHGKCWTQPEYATCPLILPTEHLVTVEVRGKEYKLKRYSAVGLHHHDGTWTTYWFGKTEYDHGFGEFCFSSEDDRRSFLEHIPEIDWGENYPWLNTAE